MNKAKKYGYEDGISDALYDLVINKYRFYKINKIDVYSKIYDYYYALAYNKFIHFVKSLYK